jgi:carboxymethylenebutenolidase
MGRVSTDQFSQDLLDLFDRYVHGAIDRRGCLEQAAKFAVGGVTAAGLLDALSPRFAEVQQVAANDTRIQTAYVEYDSPQGSGKVRAYLARPTGVKGKQPAVLVVHENRGLNPHVVDVTHRLARGGFLTLAPDALRPLGSCPGDEDKAREALAKLDLAKTREDFVAAARFLAKHPDSTGKVGVVGFRNGRGVANFLATQISDLAAAVPLYGLQPKGKDVVAHIRPPLLIHHAKHDDRINAGIPGFERALKAHNVEYQLYSTQRGFNNDTTPRYDAAAAALAWRRTVDFLKTHLHG